MLTELRFCSGVYYFLETERQIVSEVNKSETDQNNIAQNKTK